MHEMDSDDCGHRQHLGGSGVSTPGGGSMSKAELRKVSFIADLFFLFADLICYES